MMDETKFDLNFHKYCNKAQKLGNYNAYGWLMRYMQVKEDIEALRNLKDKIIKHVDREVSNMESKSSNESGDL